VNHIVIFMTCTCIALHSLFCQLPNCNLFTQHVISLWRDTSSELWTPVHSFTYITFYCKHRLLSANIIYLLQTNILFHMIHLILCFQQTSEIDNLTTSWGKVLWLCCVQVPHCCWRWSYALDKAPSTSSLVSLPKSSSNNLQKWFLSPTVRWNFGFITEGKLTVVLITPYSWGSQLVHPPTSFLAPLPGRKRISARGVSHVQSFLLCYCSVPVLHLC
jgi:hypothetical protein